MVALARGIGGGGLSGWEGPGAPGTLGYNPLGGDIGSTTTNPSSGFGPGIGGVPSSTGDDLLLPNIEENIITVYSL